MIRSGQSQLVDDIGVLTAAPTGDCCTFILITRLRRRGHHRTLGDGLRLQSLGKAFHHAEDFVRLQRAGHLSCHYDGTARLAKGESTLGEMLTGQLFKRCEISGYGYPIVTQGSAIEGGHHQIGVAHLAAIDQQLLLRGAVYSDQLRIGHKGIQHRFIKIEQGGLLGSERQALGGCGPERQHGEQYGKCSQHHFLSVLIRVDGFGRCHRHN